MRLDDWDDVDVVLENFGNSIKSLIGSDFEAAKDNEANDNLTS